jgi:hypothetical protein
VLDAVRRSVQCIHGGVMPGRCKAGGSGIPSFSGGGGTKIGSAEWAKRPSRPVGRLGRLSRKLKEIPFGIKNQIFEFIKALEICTRRFMRNFEVGIFPKFF